MLCLTITCAVFLLSVVGLITAWSKGVVRDDVTTEAERKLLRNLEERPMLQAPIPEPGPYRLLRYEEAGNWRECFHSAKLWEVEFQAGRPDDGMPWKIVRDGRLVRQCHGAAEVIEA